MAPEVGTEAPDFTLKDQNNQDVTLSSFRGDATCCWSSTRSPSPASAPVSCASSATSSATSRRRRPGARDLRRTTRSPQGLVARQQGFDFPLLSDFWPHGAVAQAYGVFNEKAGMALRGTFLIDTDGHRRVRRGQRARRRARPVRLARRVAALAALKVPPGGSPWRRTGA